MCHPRTCEEEDDEQSKGKIPRVDRVCDGREEGSKDTTGRQRLLGVCSVNERRDRGHGNFSSHAAAARSLSRSAYSVMADEVAMLCYKVLS